MGIPVMKRGNKFACDFDAIEIEAHNIIPQDNEQLTYEPADFGPGIPPDVWSVFGHITGTLPSKDCEGAGRELIADCETPEAAEFIAGLVQDDIYRRIDLLVPIYWYTDHPGCCDHPERAICDSKS